MTCVRKVLERPKNEYDSGKEKPCNLNDYKVFLVAGVGFEPHDLRVMSPTSYQAALPRDIVGAGNRARTGTRLSSHWILSPRRLPIPPLRHDGIR